MVRGAYNSVVSARTRTAEQILTTPALMTQWKALGGTKGDLEKIRDFGRQAEAFNLTQGEVRADGKASTIVVLMDFVSLSTDYSLSMGAVRAELSDLKLEKSNPQLIKKVEQILVNEAETAVSRSLDSAGNTVRRARKKATQEAIRAEIYRDAQALLGLTELRARLSERGLTPIKLKSLAGGAVRLSGKLATRTATRGEAKQATVKEREQVANQSIKWGGCYRLLSALGKKSSGVAALLTEAAG